jgi:hypothetical protein
MTKLTPELLETVVLEKGAHPKRKDGVCVMEAVAWAAGEKHSDMPSCVSTVIAHFMRQWNDDLDEPGRQLLKPYVFKVIGTVGTREQEEARGWMLSDWMVRVHVPAWLEVAGLAVPAESLRSLPAAASLFVVLGDAPGSRSCAA